MLHYTPHNERFNLRTNSSPEISAVLRQFYVDLIVLGRLNERTPVPRRFDVFSISFNAARANSILVVEAASVSANFSV